MYRLSEESLMQQIVTLSIATDSVTEMKWIKANHVNTHGAETGIKHKQLALYNGLALVSES